MQMDHSCIARTCINISAGQLRASKMYADVEEESIFRKSGRCLSRRTFNTILNQGVSKSGDSRLLIDSREFLNALRASSRAELARDTRGKVRASLRSANYLTAARVDYRWRVRHLKCIYARDIHVSIKCKFV